MEKESTSPGPKSPLHLLPPARVREIWAETNPDYGKHFTEKQWEEITGRLEALARLVWRIGSRELRNKHDKGLNPPGGPTLP